MDSYEIIDEILNDSVGNNLLEAPEDMESQFMALNMYLGILYDPNG